MKIRGNYKQDKNFITMFSNNAVYTISRDTGKWGCVRVGERAACGQILDQATYDEWEAACEKVGKKIIHPIHGRDGV